MNGVFIFKTSVHTEVHVQQVATLFGPFESIEQWSFDLEDSDRILRVVAHDLRPEAIKQLLTSAGVACEQLEYEL